MPFDHFGVIAHWYDHMMSASQDEILNNLLELPVDGRLLDAAGGTGRVAQSLCHSVHQTVLADISQGMLREAVNKPLLHVVRTLVEAFPFPGECFDRIIMVDAFHHVVDQTQTARELWRILKPGGILLIKEPDIHNSNVKIVAIAEKILLMRSHFLPAESMTRMFAKPGADIYVRKYGFDVYIRIKRFI